VEPNVAKCPVWHTSQIDKHYLPFYLAACACVGEVNYFRQGGALVAKVLRGAKPAELPAELPTKFELVINVKTARSLGITFPTSLLLRADEVIE
jgi:ABC-type uncharacterized transport system substrate-binding protein